MSAEDLLSFQTNEFRFSVWSADISARANTYKQTLSRHLSTEDEARDVSSLSSMDNGRVDRFATQQQATHFGATLRLSPPLDILEGSLSMPQGTVSASPTVGAKQEFRLDRPIFFENLAYLFEWEFAVEVVSARMIHPLSAVNDQFRFVPRRGANPARLQGTVLTGNDVGWFRLPIELRFTDGRCEKRTIAFEVLPTKMLMHDDLEAMYDSIDREVPLWRFRLVAKTEQSIARNNDRREDVFLMWLANFRALRDEFMRGLQVILSLPHHRLQSFDRYERAHQLKGRISGKRVESLREDVSAGRHDKRYRSVRKQLSANTPENRYIKYIVSYADARLGALERSLRFHEDAPENQRISDAFFDEISAWRAPLQRILRAAVFAPLEAEPQRLQESLVLQQRAGYSAVYRVWQQLKLYLDVLGDASQISMRSVAQIYEVWCFLTLAQILEDDLGFIPCAQVNERLRVNPIFEYEYAENYFEVRSFKHAKYDITATLQYEPTFTATRATSGVRSFSTPQRPDIYLEIIDATKKRFVYVFDAKYRIAQKDNPAEQATSDEVPSDAINQMHRYRDALIRVTTGAATGTPVSPVQKSRPVVGAFCLYPGFFDQSSAADNNPYWSTIHEIGIGAFPLLPRKDNHGRAWLTSFLASSLSLSEARADRAFLQEARRIPSDGMQQLFYRDLVFTASLGRYRERASSYFEAFREGRARFYHMPVRTFSSRFSTHIAHEIRYLALAPSIDEPISSITRVWPVKSVEVKKRSELSLEQAGATSTSGSLYYLFCLGEPVLLSTPVRDVPRARFQASMRLCTLSALQDAQRFDEIVPVYDGVLIRDR